MPKLVFLNKSFEEQEYALLLEKTTVGRGDHNTLVICDNSVSMTHCEILWNGPEIIIHDLDSSNGTFVEGARLHNSQMQAKHGERIRFGLVEARLELDQTLLDADDDPSASITAVRDLGDWKRAQRRKAKSSPAPSAGKVEPSALGDSGQPKTVLLPRRPDLQPVAPAPGDEGVTEKIERPYKLVGILLGLILILFLFLLWLGSRD